MSSVTCCPVAGSSFISAGLPTACCAKLDDHELHLPTVCTQYQPSFPIMSTNPERSSGRVGGEYGELRGANLDEPRLNAFLKSVVPAIHTPVVVKQFKV